MVKRWGLQTKFKGRRGGVTVSVIGRDAGQPEVARVSATLYGDEEIEGDHWEQWAGRGKYLRAIRVHVVQSIASPMVQATVASDVPVVASVDRAYAAIPVKIEDAVEPVRLRDESGHFVPDDPSTPLVNEAFIPAKPIVPTIDMSRKVLDGMADALGADVSGARTKADVVDALSSILASSDSGSKPASEFRKKRIRKKV